MRALAEIVARDLVWVERGRPAGPRAWALGTEHELRLGADVFARLRFQDRFPSEAEMHGHRWSFERVQQAREKPSVYYIVRDEEGSDVALFWHSSGLTVQFQDGNQLRFGRWRRRGEHQLLWIWDDWTQEFAWFWEPEPPLWSRRKDWDLAFEIPPTAVGFDQLPLLVVLGWYRILRQWEAARDRGPAWSEG